MRFVVLLAMLLLASVPVAGDSIIYLRPADALNLNPWQADDFYSNEIAANIYEGLVRFKKNSTAIEPCLATAWKIGADGRSWQFSLRHGVTFHDGTPFDSQSVLYSFQSRLKKKQTKFQRLSPFFSSITAVRRLGTHLVEITLDRPYAPFLVALADSAAFIQSPASAGAASFMPVGTGAYRFSSWSKNRALILVRHAGYWGGKAGVNKVVFKVMPDPLGRVLQIRNGSADMTVIQSSKEYEELSLHNGITILSNPSISTHYLGFNTRRKPFDRVEVRSAFQHVIPKGNMVKMIFQNQAQPAFTPLPPPLFPKQKAEPPDRFDLEAARSLLKTAGLPNGFTCSLYYADGQRGIEEIVNLLAVMARNIQITIRKVKLPFPELVQAASRGDHDMLILGWSSGPDPDFFLYPLFTFSPGNRNRFFYENAALTRLLDKGQTTMDPRQRERIYLDALDVLQRDVPWIPLFHLIDNLACRRRIHGLFFTPLGQVIFREVTKESSR